jgi:hypothetical protein
MAARCTSGFADEVAAPEMHANGNRNEIAELNCARSSARTKEMN